MAHLGIVGIAFELLLLDLSLLDGSFGQQSSAEELVLLIDALKEDVSDPAGAVIPPVGEQSDFDIHHYNLW